MAAFWELLFGKMLAFFSLKNAYINFHLHLKVYLKQYCHIFLLRPGYNYVIHPKRRVMNVG
jgi:hypothetical protein